MCELQRAREEQEPDDHRNEGDELDDKEEANIVGASSGDREADGHEHHRPRRADHPLHDDGPGAVAVTPSRRPECSMIRTASPPIVAGRTCPAA
jgi:hypothetical protein